MVLRSGDIEAEDMVMNVDEECYNDIMTLGQCVNLSGGRSGIDHVVQLGIRDPECPDELALSPRFLSS